ncbi:MAG TPA: glycosyltransferase [Polyangiaceae bacterium]|nr:glycosyltransferase [Polyangiaceae bacterium]
MAGDRSPHVVVVTTSYPQYEGDAQGHFVASEVRRLAERAHVTVLAPGERRRALGAERVVSLGGGDAFGFPGALARLRESPLRVLGATRFVHEAWRWLRREPRPARLIAHFLLPCGVPIATRGAARGTELEIVVHGSDARLFAALPAKRWLGAELTRSGARLRFVSSELERLVLGGLGDAQRQHLQPFCRVEPCALDVPAQLTRQQARAELGIAAQARLAVVVARLVPSKRVDIALEACSRLPGLDCVVVGDGPERARLSQRFPRARFVGHLERPRALAYLAAANALVSASLQEGAPSVVREARALGTDVVCLSAGDLARWAEHDAGIHVVT